MPVIPFDPSVRIHGMRIVVTEHPFPGLSMERQAVLHAMRATFGSLCPARLDLRPFTGWLKEYLAVKVEQHLQRTINAGAPHARNISPGDIFIKAALRHRDLCLLRFRRTGPPRVHRDCQVAAGPDRHGLLSLKPDIAR